MSLSMIKGTQGHFYFTQSFSPIPYLAQTFITLPRDTRNLLSVPVVYVEVSQVSVKSILFSLSLLSPEAERRNIRCKNLLQ